MSCNNHNKISSHILKETPRKTMTIKFNVWKLNFVSLINNNFPSWLRGISPTNVLGSFLSDAVSGPFFQFITEKGVQTQSTCRLSFCLTLHSSAYLLIWKEVSLYYYTYLEYIYMLFSWSQIYLISHNLNNFCQGHNLNKKIFLYLNIITDRGLNQFSLLR